MTRDAPQQSRADLDSGKFIAFRVGGQLFCIDIMSVREIRGWIAATPLPHAQAFLRGVINLRGDVLPVVDLACRLGFVMSDPTARHVVVVLELPGQVVGFLVEAVSDIIEIAPEAMQPTPEVASAAAKEFVRGVVASDKTMISVLRTEKLAPNNVMKFAA
jgi:purine-binding chemotaxis protein CheW